MRYMWEIPDPDDRRDQVIQGSQTAEFERLVEDKTSRFGVRRIHVIRKGAMIDIEAWKALAPADAKVYYWTFKIGSEWHLHIAWKETKCIDPVG